jgi:hypothetical protein
MMRFKEVALSNASPEAKIAGLAVLLDKELLRLSEVVLNTKKLQGPQGEQGLQGPKGEQGDRGFDGTNGKDGSNGKDGKDGEEGKQGVGVADAKIDFDGSLVITLTDGTEINAGDVVPMDTAEKIRVIGNGGGTSQYVLDAIEAINAVIDTYGTIATQDADAVAITGGSINGTTIGATAPAAGTFTTLIGGGGSANYGQLTGGATTKVVEFKSLGSDTNVALAIRTQGIGAIDLAAGSRGVNISNGGTVTAITRTAAGATAYTSQPSCAISAPTTAGGVQATGTAVMYADQGTTVASGGTGYTVGNTLTVVGGTPTGSAATFTVATVSAGVVLTVTAVNFAAYSALPSSPVATTGGTGTGCTLNVNWKLNNVTITNAGSGYVEQPTVTFSGGGGSSAAAYATVGSGSVIRALGSTSTQALDFSVASSIANNNYPVLRIKDTNIGAGTNAGYLMAQNNNGYAQLIAQGGSTNNAALFLASNGSGDIRFNTNSTAETNQMRVAHTASAVNYVQVTGAVTSGQPTISAQGSDANIRLTFASKGSEGFQFTAAGSRQFFISAQTSAVNYLQIVGSQASASPVLSAQGTDTNIDLTLTPKGTGNVRFGTYTANMALTIQGYIEIKDSGGTTRRLAVIA